MERIKLNIQRFAGNSISISAWETRTDIGSNTSYVHVVVSCSTNSTTYNTSSGYVSVSASGQNNSYSTGNVYAKYTKSMNNATIWEGDLGPFDHNSDGSLNAVSLSAYAHITSSTNLSASGSCSMSTIPRYANITSFSVNKRDETSVSISYTVDASINYAWYSKDNGASWSNLPSNNIITGLSANTGYNFKIRVRRSNSNLTTDSGTYYQTTYDYPNCTSCPNFVISQKLTLPIYNPLRRSVTVALLSLNDTVLSSLTTSSTSVEGFNDETTINALYGIIPNDPSGKYKVRVTYGSINKVKYEDRTDRNNFSVDANENKPTFEDFTYSTNLNELTGNHDTIVNGVTTTTFTISSANKAIAKNGATMQRYSCVCGDYNPTIVNYSNNDVTAQVSNCSSNILKVTAIDSRGLETTVTKTVSNFKSYTPPSFASAAIEREDGIEEDAFVDSKINFWNANFGTRRNGIKEMYYRVKQKGSENWSNWFAINTSSLVVVNNTATLENYQVYLNGISTGFTIGTTYEIQLKVIDGASNTAVSEVESNIFELADGQVAFSIFRDSNGDYHIGINGMPSESKTLKVHGTIENS